MSANKSALIICPNCGAEYLPAEIFLPDDFLGKPSCIEKESMSGKIMGYFGNSMNCKERYVCDYCGTPFTATASVKFNTKIDDSANFNSGYTVSYKKQALFLEED